MTRRWRGKENHSHVGKTWTRARASRRCCPAFEVATARRIRRHSSWRPRPTRGNYKKSRKRKVYTHDSASGHLLRVVWCQRFGKLRGCSDLVQTGRWRKCTRTSTSPPSPLAAWPLGPLTPRWSGRWGDKKGKKTNGTDTQQVENGQRFLWMVN